MIEIEKLYELEPLEEINIEGRNFLRVPGGWRLLDYGAGRNRTSCFIPFNNEFQPKEKLKFDD